jgi:hypothetical protein
VIAKCMAWASCVAAVVMVSRVENKNEGSSKEASTQARKQRVQLCAAHDHVETCRPARGLRAVSE